MKKAFIFFLSITFLTACEQSGIPTDRQSSDLYNKQGDLGNGTFLNPILGGDFPDPTIMRDGDDFYMTHSCFNYLPGLTVYHSQDLVNWQPISFGLKTYLGSIWAPDITKHNDKYFIYFTVAFADGHRSNYVVWAESPYGPWSDPIDLEIGNIDPGHAVGEDGTQWMFLSSGKRARMRDDGLGIVPGTEKVVYDGWRYPSEWLAECFCLESPKIRKIDEYYYYLNAQGGTAGPPTSHMVVAARSKSIDGPWENSPYNPIVRTWENSDRWWSKGHGSLIDTPEGDWYIVYHAYENGFYNLGRATLIEPIEWTSDGWFKTVDQIDIEKPIAKPIASKEIIDRRAQLGDFRVGLDWKFYRDYDPSRFTVRDGVLALKAKGDMPGNSSPMMFVAGNHAYEVEVEIEKNDDTSAGIILYYDDEYYAGSGFDSGHRFRFRHGKRTTAGVHQNGNHMWLRIRNQDQVVTGYYSYDGINWFREEWGMDLSGYNHNTLHQFQSVLPALYASGNGEVRFKNFKYTQL